MAAACNVGSRRKAPNAITVGTAERDPAADLFGALETPRVRNFASLTEPAAVAPLLRALWGDERSPVVHAALTPAPLGLARPGELRTARWKDIDLAAGEWRYVAFKTGTPHSVPLASQAVEVLIEHQLAHAVRDPNGREYNRTTHLTERRKMLQAWADYLEGLRTQM